MHGITAAAAAFDCTQLPGHCCCCWASLAWRLSVCLSNAFLCWNNVL